MLDSLLNPIKLAEYDSVNRYDGKGNFAVNKYYHYPYRPFYRKKLYMIRSLLDKGRIYKNILDFGAGPGIFTPELKRHAISVVSVNEEDFIDKRSKFECVVAGSSLEFVDDLVDSIKMLHEITYSRSQLIVASPTDGYLSRLYFKSIGDKLVRNSPSSIMAIVDRWFKIDEYHEWMGLYFSFKAYRRA